MKYWLLTSEYPPFYGGGIGTYCAYTAKMLAAAGHEITVFVPELSGDNDIIQFDGTIRIIRFSTKKTKVDEFLGYQAFISYELARTISDYLKTESKPDIIEIQDYQGLGYYLQLFRHLLYEEFQGLNVLTTLHVTSWLCLKYNKEPIYKFPTYWIGEMEKSAILASDLVVAPSEYIISRLGEDFRLTDKTIHVLPNPIAIPSTLEPIAATNRQEVVFLGKLVYLKGYFELLEYFVHLWKKGSRVTLKIIGDGDFILHTEGVLAKDYVNAKYKEYIDSGLLILLGKLSQEEIKKHVSVAHMVVIPSIFDNLPYTVLEMMLAGKVVLASTQGGHIEVIRHGKNGFLFEHQNPETFYEQFNAILSMSDDEVREIGGNARETIIGHYSPERIYPQKIRIIEDYLSRKNKEPETIFPFIRPIPEVLPAAKPSVPSDSSSALSADPSPAENMVKGLLSVVIPYYNMGDLVFETIGSVKKTEAKNIEILIINDGSNEPASLEALQKIRKSYKEVTVLDKVNSGLGHTRNYGALKAKGEFIAFLDADDTVEPEYFLRSVKVLSQYKNVHYAGSWVKYFGGASGIWPAFMPEPPYYLLHNSLNSSGLVFRRSSFIAGGMNDTAMTFQGYEDWECVVSMIAKGMYGVAIPEPLFNYRVRKGSMYRKINKIKRLYLHTYVTNKHPEIYARFSGDIINLLNANGPGMNYDNPSREQSRFGDLFSSPMASTLKRVASKNPMLKRILLMIKKRLQ